MARLKVWLLPIRLAPAMAVLVLLALLPAPAPRGQETEAEPQEESPLSRPFLERESVRLVQVPVTVVDRKGRPVLDLQQADFELFVDGSPQPIEVFEPPLDIDEPVVAPGTVEMEVADSSGRDAGAVDKEPPAGELSDVGAVDTDAESTVAGDTGSADVGRIDGAATAAIPASPPTTKSYVALVFDRYMTTYRGVARAFSALEGFLEEGGSPHQEIGLFSLVHGSIRTLQPFTSDVVLLEAALEGAFQDARQSDNWLTEEGSRQYEVLEVLESLKCGRITAWSLIQAQRGRNVLMGLESLARAMVELKGRKSVVLLTDGIRIRAGLNYAYILNGGGSHAGYKYERCTSNLLAEYQRMTRTFKAANVTLSPVSMMGLTFPAQGDPDALDELLNASKFMAEETGGRVPHGLNDFQREVTAAVEQPLQSYVLGFRATESMPGTARAIEVRVNRKRVQVFARTEYVEPPETFETDSRFASALLFPGRAREIGGEATLFTLPVTSKRRELHMQLTIPGEALSWLVAAGGRRQADLQINGLLRDETGRADEVLKSAYVIKAGSGGPPSRLVIQQSVVAEVKQPSELVLVALDQVSGMVSSWAIPVAGPEKTRSPMLVTEPIFLAAARGSQVISSGGDPGLSRRLQEQLYLPVAGVEAEGDPVADQERILVMSRIVNLPEGATVRFCLDDGRCITAELREDVPPAETEVEEAPDETARAENVPPAGDEQVEEAPEEIVQAEDVSAEDGEAPTLWSAWLKIPARALASGSVRVEVVSSEGALLAAKIAEDPPGRHSTP